MTNEEIVAIKERAEAATKGPWAWRLAYGGYGIPELFFRKGMLLVMDAVRHGMGGATIRFATRTADDHGGLMYKAHTFFDPPTARGPEFQEPSNPDMVFMAHARKDIPDLLAELARWQRYASYLACCARSGEHEPLPIETFESAS
jgi:hypothetical protein